MHFLGKCNNHLTSSISNQYATFYFAETPMIWQNQDLKQCFEQFLSEKIPKLKYKRLAYV